MKGIENVSGFTPLKNKIGGSGTSPSANVPLTSTIRHRPALHVDQTNTTRCVRPKGNWLDNKGKERPLVQYALMIDAGSTGSRVHVYKFNFCEKAPELEDEFFDKVQGGLSNFKDNPSGAADSLRPLLEKALQRVPLSLRACAPIAVKATAGLRLLGPQQSEAILAEVRNMLEKDYPFPIADGKDINGRRQGVKGVQIMDGKEEGVYAWITVNYLLNRIGASQGAIGRSTAEHSRTAAVIDLGGASTQIVFEPTFKTNSQGMSPGKHVYELKDFGARPLTLYQNSYLGYGLMEARNSINSLASFVWNLSHPNALRQGALAASDPSSLTVPHPCFAKDRQKPVNLKHGGAAETKVIFKGTGAGFDACRRFVEVMMDKDAVCQRKPCSFAGVYQPSLMSAFAEAPIVALSYFYDRLVPLGLESTFTVAELASLAKDVCKAPSTWATRFPASKYPEALKELEGRPETCLDLTFMHSLLSLGYELDDSRTVTVAKKLADTELGWALGAQLAVLEEDGVLCKMVR
ncbi:nucleoside phosphatase GDA1/CD39 [Tilletiaria anomala UBC 951]|uniref:guanosine-diphosphatase n=1 Tax=Tilletiaria anomala (strain ATCC 24038 / CBS 436.72 / UBC 951) TaxID=1037660 RepID=A0A066VHM2_TILAU|nr:nucleoside phosphatase GDA1/CD39 [Tilletiaria anomala UBC 951]KDN41227.1 nucleoside phosphatase GDA1/CD39 [Tilletiaria anomala UBC 951]